MSDEAAMGRRIRERRERAALGQAALARRVGISASYLNLIEHGHRRIGGKLLADLAGALGTATGSLAQGPDAATARELAAAAAEAPETGAETDSIDAFVARFPGWAALVRDGQRRTGRLARTADALADRLAHDPALAGSLHELVSAATAVRATAAILTESETVDAAWQTRFHRNLRDEGARLATEAQTLAGRLQAGRGAAQTAASPWDQLDTFLAGRDWHVAELEERIAPPPARLVADEPAFVSNAGRALAEDYLARYRAEARAVPRAELAAALAAEGPAPGRIARRVGADPLVVMRRLASLPSPARRAPTGLAVCDGAGTLTLAKPLADFPLPRSGGGCPLWPLYAALAQPGTPLRRLVETPGPLPKRFLTFAYCRPAEPADFDGPPVREAAMLILPAERIETRDAPPAPVGPSCRICPRSGCPARREPSILAAGG